LARTILPDGYGVIGFAIALIYYFSNIIIFGGDTIATRDVSLNRNKFSLYFTNIISFRIVVTILLVIILFPLISFISKDIRSEYVIKIILLSLFLNTFSTNFLYQAIERMEIIAISNLLRSLLLLSGYLLFVNNSDDVYAAAWVFTISSVSVSLAMFLFTHFTISKFRYKIKFSLIGYLLKESYPLFISSIAIAVYYNLDIIMLSYLKTDFDVGIYNAAYRIFLVGVLPINFILQSFFPQLSRIYNLDDRGFWFIMNKYAFSQFFLGVSASIIIYVLSGVGINLIFGHEYISASIALKILALNISVVSVNVLFGNPLTAWGKQKQYSFVIVAGALANVFLNFILIPKYSFNGAALATLLSEFIVFVGVLILFNTTLKSRRNHIYEI
jgi:O-antigen/teichoic acid export membrane protein